MTNVRTYNEDNFHDIAWGEGLAVIRFFAPWCPPCRESEAEYLQFAKKLGPHVKVGVVNVDKSPVLSTRYEVFGLPSVLVFRNGQLMKRITGQKTAEQYAAIFSSITEHEADVN